MNRALRSFIHNRLAGGVEGPDTTDYILQPDRMVKVGEDRPDWGSTQQMEAEIREKVAGLRKDRE